ncbi:MAG: choice-of-anchor J domain-containing protein [Bacteroidetes bacterium]|nr:choice-of-anchor J domain-containing protein [Bacteroidota bacterium]
MKRITVFLIFLTSWCQAQQWVNMMNDNKTNFYQTQKEFYNYYEQEMRKQNLWHKKVFRFLKKEKEREVPGYEQFKRWEYFMTPRVFPTGRRLEGDLAWKEYFKYIKKHNLTSEKIVGNWTSLGPSSWLTNSYNPGLGRVNIFYIDPNDSLSWWMGTPSGGLWHSIDAGNTWISNTDSLPTLGVSAVAIAKGNSNTIYIGTGDKDAGDTYGVGILKSTDGGITWNTTGLAWNLNQAQRVTKILIYPNDTNAIITSTNNGIYKSTDGGLTFNLVLAGSFRDIEFMPGNDNVVYACGTEFFRSTDGGNTFNLVTSGLPSASDVNHLQIGVTPHDSNYVYVIAGDDATSGYYGLYRSINGGVNFSLRSSNPNILSYALDGIGSGGQSWYDLTIAVSPTNKNHVFAGGINLWNSLDGGTTWDIISHWYYPNNQIVPYVHADQHCLEFYKNKLIVGCDGGAFYSDDMGTTWNDRTAGVVITQFYRLGASATNEHKIMAGAQDNGSNFYDRGQWTHVLGADGMEEAIDPTDTNTLYACGQGGWLNRSMDAGITMSTISPGGAGGGNWVTPYMLDPSDNNTIYAAYGELWKSNDKGDNWNQISNFNSQSNLDFFSVAPSNSDVIYVTNNDSIFYTDDGGATWQQRTPPNAGFITYLCIDPTNASRVWATYSSGGNGKHAVHSPDAGITWTDITGNLPNVSANCIVYQAGSDDGLYVATDIGVFYKDTLLSNWQPYWQGMPIVNISELEIFYPTNKIRAATYGRGIWESDLFISNQAPPQANFTSDRQSICPADSVHFYDASINAYQGWQWSFTGGVPSTSTLANPVVHYPTGGMYDVQLIVSNPFGTDTITVTNYITVAIPASQSIPFAEGFENMFLLPDWRLINADANMTWIIRSVGGFGKSIKSIFVDNYAYNSVGASDVILTAPFDLTTISNPLLSFDVAYTNFPGYYDTLKVFYSFDCGVTRTYIFNKGGVDLLTTPTTQAYFIPDSNEWMNYQLSLSSIATSTSVQFGFENINGYGNCLYIDNINLGQPTSLPQGNKNSAIKIYPNPANGQLHINGATKNSTCQIFDAKGQLVLERQVSENIVLDISILLNGIYTIKIATGTSEFNTRLTVLHQ